MKIGTLSLLLVALGVLVASTPVRALDCTVSCPSGRNPQDVIGGLNILQSCTIVYDVLPEEPNSWCKATYAPTGAVQCDSCDAELFPVQVCASKVVTVSPTFPYDTVVSCPRSLDWVNAVVPCCDEIKPAACQGACGIATCSIGDCVNNKCVNPSCPSDADCVCDEEPGHRLSLAITNLM